MVTSKEDFVAWLRSFPADEKFYVNDSARCPFTRWISYNGVKPSVCGWGTIKADGIDLVGHRWIRELNSDMEALAKDGCKDFFATATWLLQQLKESRTAISVVRGEYTTVVKGVWVKYDDGTETFIPGEL